MSFIQDFGANARLASGRTGTPGFPTAGMVRVFGFEAFYAPHAILPEHEHGHPLFTYVLRGDDRLSAVPGLLEVAHVVGVHPMHLAKLFRRRYGCSMGEFVRRRRIAWACDQLAEESMTISAIAAQAGFADHAHFTRTVRRLTGCTPQWYRARLTGRRPVRR